MESKISSIYPKSSSLQPITEEAKAPPPEIMSRATLQSAMSLPSGSVMSESSQKQLLAALEQTIPSDAAKDVPLSLQHSASSNSSWIHGPNAGLYRISAVLPQGASKLTPSVAPSGRRPSASVTSKSI